MEIIFADGEEIQFAADSPGLWNSYSTNMGAGKLTYVGTHPRTGAGGFRVISTTWSGYSYKSKTLSSPYTELYFQFALYFASTTALSAYSTETLVPLLALKSSTSVTQITLGLNETSQVLQIYRGNNKDTLLGSGSTGLTADTMYYIELHVVISDTVGVVQVRLNGDLEIDLSAQDTNNAGGGDVNSFDQGITWNGSASQGASIDAFFDDVIVADDWPGGAGVHKRSPNADGSYTQWASTGGAVDSTEVDDVATYGNLPDDDTTKLSHAVVGERTSVALDAMTVDGTVLGIVLLSDVKNSVAGADQMAQFIRTGSVDYDQTTFVPATSYGWRADILSLNPGTGVAFTISEIDNLELGWVVK